MPLVTSLKSTVKGCAVGHGVGGKSILNATRKSLRESRTNQLNDNREPWIPWWPLLKVNLIVSWPDKFRKCSLVWNLTLCVRFPRGVINWRRQNASVRNWIDQQSIKA